MITYLTFRDQLSKVGGIVFSIYGSLLVVTNFFLRRQWLQDVMHSVFNKNIDDKKTIQDFKQRISYKGLNNLNEKIKKINEEIELM